MLISSSILRNAASGSGDLVIERPTTRKLAPASAASAAGVLKAQGEVSEVARIFRVTLEEQRRVVGAEHPSPLASASDLR